MEDILLNPQAVIAVAIIVVTILALLNAFFIKALVNKIELVSNDMPVMKQQISEFDRELRDLSRDLKDMGSVRERIAVLEYALNKLSDNKSGGGLK